MDWLARARNDFIIYLGHDRFQCANRNCLLRRSGVVNVASSSSRREWQFVSPIKLIASVRDWSRCSDRATSLTKGVAWSSLILEKDDGSSSIGSSIGEEEGKEETRFDSIDLYPLIFELHDNFSIDSIDFRCWKFWREEYAQQQEERCIQKYLVTSVWWGVIREIGDKGIRNDFFMIIKDMMDDNRDEIYKAITQLSSCRCFIFRLWTGTKEREDIRPLT